MVRLGLHTNGSQVVNVVGWFNMATIDAAGRVVVDVRPVVSFIPVSGFEKTNIDVQCMVQAEFQVVFSYINQKNWPAALPDAFTEVPAAVPAAS